MMVVMLMRTGSRRLIAIMLLYILQVLLQLMPLSVAESIPPSQRCILENDLRGVQLDTGHIRVTLFCIL